ncbi:tRNA lysidine(34) synthetase TilS [Colwellia piezophila]|uniref:tRNA lysidine(34) synthetase TilS n=1 Tax=Colwellia piezophila TaxID=211668 RepID=UPI0003600D39|nr:tRNA lysidine(34) synthetase TilS [Colwellia piezophila]
MNKITSSLHSTIKSLSNTHGDIELIVAYSGGIDSQVLLHALAHLKQKKIINNKITVCHVNHGLSDNAQRWQEFAHQECDKLSLRLVIKSVNVQPKAQLSLEALAREARYAALKSLSNEKSLVLTGHHSDDQSETFLLALKRGAGLKGLSAMSEQIPLGKHILVRPLLTTSRLAIEAYAKAHQLSWVEDESNEDTCFDRNFIRQQIMPLLRARWPSINNTINRSASHCLASQELLDELAEQDLSACKASELSLHIQTLTNLSSARFNNLIRYFMAINHCLMPSTEQLKQVRQQLTADGDKNPEIKVANHFLRRFKNTLYLTPQYSDLSAWQRPIDLSKEVTEIVLPDNLGALYFKHIAADYNELSGICLPKLGQQVVVRFSHSNPKCLPDFRQHSRSLKKVLQELHIPPWQRKRIAFLYYDNELVAAIGHFICQSFIARPNEKSMQVICHQ